MRKAFPRKRGLGGPWRLYLCFAVKLDRLLIEPAVASVRLPLTMLTR